MASVKQKFSTKLVLQMDQTRQGCTGVLLPQRWVDSNGADTTADKDLIWCTNLLRGRQSPERMALQRALPLNSEVAYYNPREEENPTACHSVNDDTGDEEIVDGTWTLVLRAPQPASFGEAVKQFMQVFMGLNSPMTETGFRHTDGTKFITKFNRNPANGNTWTTRCTLKLEWKGVVTEGVAAMLNELFGEFSFLQWSGKFAHDPHGAFSAQYACECTSMDDCSKKLANAKLLRRAAAKPEERSPSAPIPTEPYDMNRVPAPCLWQPDKSIGWTCQTGKGGRVISESSDQTATQSGAVISQPFTPPARIAKQEDPPSSCKRQKIHAESFNESDEKVERFQSIGGSEDAFGRDHALASSAIGASSASMSDDVLALCDEEMLDDEEQGMFTAALTTALLQVQHKYPEVKDMMVEQADWSGLQLIQQGMKVMSTCINGSHAGATSDWRRSTAVHTVDIISKNLSASSLFQSSITSLHKWDKHAQSLQSVRDCFDTHWPASKALLIANDKWEVLHALTSARRSLGIGAGDPLECDRQSVLHALQSLHDVTTEEDLPLLLACWPVRGFHM
jgi:hypothetical protein